jgi:MerR HTH family regulatory protein
MANVSPENHIPIRNHYPHASDSVPEHVGDLHRQAENPQAPRIGEGEKAVPMQPQVVYQSRHSKLLLEALENPNHKYRQRAIQAVRRFSAAIEKDMAQDLIQDKGILMEQASRKYGVPASTLRGWEAMGLLTVLYRGRGKQGVYYNEEEVAQAAPVYHEAKQQGVQPAKRLKAMRAQQAEGNPQPSP